MKKLLILIPIFVTIFLIGCDKEIDIIKSEKSPKEVFINMLPDAYYIFKDSIISNTLNPDDGEDDIYQLKVQNCTIDEYHIYNKELVMCGFNNIAYSTDIGFSARSEDGKYDVMVNIWEADGLVMITCYKVIYDED